MDDRIKFDFITRNDGIKKLAPTGVMLMFAILYFGIMIDAGLFEPLVKWILAWVKGDPYKVVVATAGAQPAAAAAAVGDVDWIPEVSREVLRRGGRLRVGGRRGGVTWAGP